MSINKTGLILLILTAIGWSLSGVIIKTVEMEALPIAFYRSAIAGIFSVFAQCEVNPLGLITTARIRLSLMPLPLFYWLLQPKKLQQPMLLFCSIRHRPLYSYWRFPCWGSVLKGRLVGLNKHYVRSPMHL